MTRAQCNLYGCLVVFILILTSAVIQAQEDEAFVQYRQKVTSNSANMGAIGDILKTNCPIRVISQSMRKKSSV